MKPLVILLIITIFSGCTKKQKPASLEYSKIVGSQVADTTTTPSEIIKEKHTKVIVKQVIACPIIKDSTQFIASLIQKCNLQVDEIPVQKEKEKITVFKKVKLYGSDDDFIFVEYYYGTGAMVFFPYKYQLLFTTEGKLVKHFWGLRYDFVTIFPKQNPFLVIVEVTAKGNGGHRIYQITSDSVENVYEGYYNYNVQTYDAHQDIAVFKPNELKMSFKDVNSDGYNDITFSGEKLMLCKFTEDGFYYDVENGKAFSVEHPADIIPVQYIFLYNEASRHFKAASNY